MKIIETGIEGLKVIELQKFEDDRGFFMEKFNKKHFADNGLNSNLMQVNHSLSHKGILRGLHFQTDPWQGKIVSCISGSINDVAVDIRKNSPTFGKNFAIKIDCPEIMLYIPYGFAHGFETLSETANVLYFTDALYNSQSDGGIHYDSCGIQWETKKPLLSQKDTQLPTFHNFASK